ncbi:hypothetical protein GOP47_0030090 [Adiantum capillus-veneris]|nr:hypothetical protein GOP47_0030090 [Adiantum capillus-veneris]
MQQLHKNDQTREEYAPSAAHMTDTIQDTAAAQSRGLGGGTDVMGEPINPTSQQGYADSPAPDYSGSYPTSGGSYPSTTDSQTPTNLPSAASATHSSAAGLPPSQIPGQSTSATHQSTSSANPAQTSPYVQTTSIPGGTSKTPMDSIMNVFNKWTKKAEDMTGNVWSHLKTGPNVADTALGRLAIGTKAMAEGGLENVFRQSFEVAPEEHLLKSFACYLSTSTGPVAGTLYLSTHKLAFCSDRPLAIPGSSSSPTAKQSTPHSKTHSAATDYTSSAQQQQQWVFYKVAVPVSQLDVVNPVENTKKKPSERYVQVKTVDGHEFWFLGFVNYDKGVKNLQDTLARNTNVASGTVNSTPSSNMYSDPASTATNAPYSATNSTPSSNKYSDRTSTTTNAPYIGADSSPSGNMYTCPASTNAPQYH